MKTQKLVQTHNVVEANQAVRNLLSRNVTEIRGLCVVYGPTGTGKTAWAERQVFGSGWLFYRLKKTETPKSFLQAIYQRLARCHLKEEDVPRVAAAALEERVIDMLADHPETVLFIDEVNLVTQSKRWSIVEVIRDLIDKTFATIVLLGEENLRKHLEGYNRHFFDRCNFFHEFEPNTVEDYAQYISDVSDVAFSKNAVKWLHRSTEGNLRKACKTLQDIEKLAAANNISELSATTLTQLLEAQGA